MINLYGPPGVGKTLSAEATSEHVRRPLYVVGGGDLGTTAAELDEALQKTFDIATSWKAIVLIDEVSPLFLPRSLSLYTEEVLTLRLGRNRLTSSLNNDLFMIWSEMRWSPFSSDMLSITAGFCS